MQDFPDLALLLHSQLINFLAPPPRKYKQAFKTRDLLFVCKTNVHVVGIRFDLLENKEITKLIEVIKIL